MTQNAPSIRLILSAATAAALVVACGSDKPQPATTPITSVDSSKSLSSLSSAEMQTLCSDLGSYIVRETSAAYAERACIQSAVVAASNSDASLAVQACHSAYDTCMGPSYPKDSSGVTISRLCPSAAPDAPSCTLAVSQFVQCITDLTPLAVAAWALQRGLCDNLISCSGSCNSTLMLPPSCVQVNNTCPGLGPSVLYTISG